MCDFSLEKLAKHCGQDVRIDPGAVIKELDGFSIGDHVAIDQGFYCTVGQVQIKDWVHIAPYVCMIGGKIGNITVGNYVGIAPYSMFICSMDDYSRGFMTAVIPDIYRYIIVAPIILNDFVAIASRVTVCPGVVIPEGVSIGAHSLVREKDKLEPWTIYAGTPLRKIGIRSDIAKSNVQDLAGWKNRKERKG